MRLLIAIIWFYFVGNAVASAFKVDALKYLMPLLLILGIIKTLIGSKGRIYIPRIENKGQLLFLICFLLINLYSFFRTNNESATTVGFLNIAFNKLGLLVVMYGTFSHLFLNTQSWEEFLQKCKSAINSVYIPVALTVIGVILCYLLGIQGPQTEPVSEEDLTPGLLAGLLGLDFGRTSFIIGGHPNGFGVFLSLVALFSSVMLMNGNLERKQKWLVIATLCFCFFAILIVDSRGALAIYVFSFAIAFFFKKLRLGRFLLIGFWAIPLIAISISGVLKFVAETDLGKSLSRSENELATGNSRSYIWGACLDQMGEFEDKHLFGYGQQGHLPSGVAIEYGKYLGRIVYTHSFLFQVFFDMGYVGLILIYGTMFLILRIGLELERHQIPYALMIVVFPIGYGLSGIFEAPYGEYNHLCTAILDIMGMLAVLFYGHFLTAKRKFLAREPRGQMA